MPKIRQGKRKTREDRNKAGSEDPWKNESQNLELAWKHGMNLPLILPER
jgi:hypothetical protein